MKSNIEELRKKYMDNPPEGMTSKDIRNMSEDELLDMDYFLNEDDLFSDEAGVEGFIPFNQCHLFIMLAFMRAFFIHESNKYRTFL
ncbi:MAG: hypothetical protein ACLU8S_04115 [Coprococcus phoceensis]